jgi:hypothetical protein
MLAIAEQAVPARIATRSVAGAARSCETPLQIRAPETGLELFLSNARAAFGTAGFIVL